MKKKVIREGVGPGLKGKPNYPAKKQTNKPVGKSHAPGKSAPKQTNKPTGSPGGK